MTLSLFSIVMGVTEYFTPIILFIMGFFTEGIANELTTGYIYNENMTWNKAFDKCQMVGLDNKVNVSVESTTIAWVGASAYYTPWTEFKGCFIFNDTTVLDIHLINQTNPFLSCSELCQDYTYFGLQDLQCACLKVNTLSSGILIRLCRSKPCDADVNALCSDEEYGFVIYKKETSISFTKQVGNCLTVIKNNVGKHFYDPRSCSQEHQFICQPAFNLDIIGTTTVNREIWVKGYTECPTPYTPASLSVIEKHGSPAGTFWIGATRRYVEIYPPAPKSTYCIAAHVTVNGNIMRSVRDCNDRLPVLCKRVPFVMNMNDRDDSSLKTEGLVVLVLSIVLAVVAVLSIVLFIRLKIKARNTGNQSSAEPERADIVYAQVNKPPKNSRQNNTTHMNNEQTSYDVYDHMDHTCRPHDLSESNYDTMQSIEAKENNEDLYDTANTSGEWNITIDKNDEYSRIEICDAI